MHGPGRCSVFVDLPLTWGAAQDQIRLLLFEDVKRRWVEATWQTLSVLGYQSWTSVPHPWCCESVSIGRLPGRYQGYVGRSITDLRERWVGSTVIVGVRALGSDLGNNGYDRTF